MIKRWSAILAILVMGASSAADLPKTLTLDLGKGATLELVLVPAGEFQMGSADGEDNEKPAHKVALTKPFYLGKFEVTQAQYEAVVGINPSKFRGPTNPVEFASWEDTQKFCKKVSEKTGKTVTLPTEAQWEYACRAGTTTEYANGGGLAALKKIGWCSYDGDFGSALSTKAAGSLAANAWGLHDMHGNLWEWCLDVSSDEYYKSSPPADPTGPTEGHAHIVRGGSWYAAPASCRASFRMGMKADYQSAKVGFRIAVLP